MSTINGLTSINCDFINNVPSSTLTYLDATSSIQTQINSKTSLTAVESANYVWTGTQSYNTYLPQSTITPTVDTQLVTKKYVNDQDNLRASLANANTFTGTNTFNTSLPTSTLTTATSTNFITKGIADALYTTITGLSSYVTSSSLATTLSSYATFSGTNNFTGTNTFNTNLPTSTVTPTTASQFVTKTYVDTQDNTKATLAGANAFTSTNTFNISLPTSTVTPTTAYHLATKAYVDNQNNLQATLASANSFTGSNLFSGLSTFNISLPTSTVAPVNGNDLCTKTYVDGKTTLSAVQSNNNAFTGTNTFSIVPSSSATPVGVNDLCNKSYVDGQVATKTTLSAVQSANYAWTGTQGFNTYLPTSTITPTSDTQLVTKVYCDSKIIAISSDTSSFGVNSGGSYFNVTNTLTRGGTTIATGTAGWITVPVTAWYNISVTIQAVAVNTAVSLFTCWVMVNGGGAFIPFQLWFPGTQGLTQTVTGAKIWNIPASAQIRVYFVNNNANQIMINGMYVSVTLVTV